MIQGNIQNALSFSLWQMRILTIAIIDFFNVFIMDIIYMINRFILDEIDRKNIMKKDEKYPISFRFYRCMFYNQITTEVKNP